MSGDLILQVLLELCYGARREFVLTTPYLIPDDSMLRALRSAAARGVRVDLVVPERVDSFLVRHASRSFFDDLLQAGVHVHLFESGLLHTKSVTVDGRTALFGTVNLDMRSIWLNYEVSLVVHDADFVGRLRALQQSYMAASRAVDPVAWRARPFARRFLEDAARLVSPLL
jgi:cardiolipin synthase